MMIMPEITLPFQSSITILFRASGVPTARSKLVCMTSHSGR